MGCNTSKDNQSGEAADNNKENENQKENQTQDEAVENHSNESNDKKPPSAKTITLRPKSTASVKSNGSAVSPVSANSCKLSQNNKNKGVLSAQSVGKGKSKESEEGTTDEAEAATKIQAAFRGHKARQSMKQPAGNKNETREAQDQNEPTREQLEEEFRSDDEELCNAATKIQASFRGHLTRKQAEKKSDEGSSIIKKTQEQSEIDDIDLGDPELNKAAVKIQASFRGHLVRKEHEEELHQNNVTK